MAPFTPIPPSNFLLSPSEIIALLGLLASLSHFPRLASSEVRTTPSPLSPSHLEPAETPLPPFTLSLPWWIYPLSHSTLSLPGGLPVAYHSGFDSHSARLHLQSYLVSSFPVPTSSPLHLLGLISLISLRLCLTLHPQPHFPRHLISEVRKAPFLPCPRFVTP